MGDRTGPACPVSDGGLDRGVRKHPRAGLNAGVRLSHGLDIAAPVDRVWSLTEDLEAWPSLTPTMLRVERREAGPLRVGSTATVAQPRLRPAVWRVTQLDPPHRFVWETTTLGTRFVAGHHVEAGADGCRNTLTLDLGGAGARALGLAAGRALRAALATENDGFRRVAEGLTRPRFVDEHRTVVRGPRSRAWQAVRRHADTLSSDRRRGVLTGLLGTEPASGFEVAEEVRPRLLSLVGGHRFSRYVLDFRLRDEGEDAVEVSAVTYADFPGVRGRVYRSAVIGSRAHAVAVRRMLAGISSLA